jgi:recombination protein RecA
VIFINQIRMKIGVMFGNPETTTGGNALKFYSSVRIDLRRIETLKRADEAYGNRVRAKIVKNKIAPPFKEAEFEIHFNEGISYNTDLMDLAVKHNVIEKSGAWLSFEGERLGQGRENTKKFLDENLKVAQKVEKVLQEKIKGGSKPTVEVKGKRSDN